MKIYIFLNETQIETNNNFITQLFIISNPIENTNIKIYIN